MSYQFAVLEEGQLLLVVFEGEITPEQEGEALLASAELPGLSKQARVLVDRRAARLTSGPEDVRPHMDLARGAFPGSERPCMAVVVSADYDFGMLRMLELKGEGQLPHDLKVFRNLDEACDWVDVDPERIAWP